jgi:acetylornithine deacetylase/succinyl-diaminopimelate desuccinylase-like protein
MGDEIINKIENLVEEKKEEIIDFALSCVKQLSENPPGDETAVANLIMEKAADWGLREPKIWAEKKNRPNLLFSIKGRGKGKVLILLGHMDTKPIGDVSKWGVIDPYKPVLME